MGKNPLIREVARRLCPRLAAAGFVQHGLTYRLRSESGDWAVIDLQTSTEMPPEGTVFFIEGVPVPSAPRSEQDDRAVAGPRASTEAASEKAGFFINVAAVPGIWWEWMTRDRPQGKHGPITAEGIWRDRVEPIPPFESHSRWLVSAATMGALTDVVWAALESAAVPRLMSLLDRATLIDALPPHEGLSLRIAFAAERGDMAAIEELAREVNMRDAHRRRFVEWARRTARSSAPPPASAEP